MSNSVIHQEERLRAHLAGFEGEHELVDIYKDDGYTGTDTDREDFQRMLKDIRKRRVNCVMVKDLSRLSRNVTDATYYIENVFIEYDVRFISLELPALDSFLHPEQMNSILVPIQNVINDDFCRQTSIKVRGVFDQKRMLGQFIGAFAPYGYVKAPSDKHHFLIDSEAAQVVRDIFFWYVKEGLSKGGIARRLNDIGIPNPAAYKRQKGLNYSNIYSGANDGLWSPKTIREILSNMMYLGHMVQGKQRVKSYKVHTRIRVPREEWFVVEDMHEPIVDKGLFAQAKILQERDMRQTPGQRSLYLLSGFVRCPDCGKAMVRSQGGSTKKVAYYQCRTYRDKTKKLCTKHSIRADVLEDVVFYALKAQMSLVSSHRDIAIEIDRTLAASDEPQKISGIIAAREKELKRLNALEDSLYEDWKGGEITRDDFHRLKARYGGQAQALANIITNLKNEQGSKAESGSNSPYLQAFLERGTVSELVRSAVVDFILAVYVHENGGVEIAFNYRDPHRGYFSGRAEGRGEDNVLSLSPKHPANCHLTEQGNGG